METVPSPSLEELSPRGVVSPTSDEQNIESTNDPPLNIAPTDEAPLDLNDEELELQALDSPPAIFNCPGHWLVRHSDPDREGVVGSVDLESQIMKVLYEKDNEPNQFTTVEISYHEPNLHWYQEKNQPLFMNRKRPSFETAIGNYILLVEEKEKEEHDHQESPSVVPDMALVVDLNQRTKMLKVQFVEKISRDGRVVCDEELEEVPYSTLSLIWMQGN
jgi:hypothetical protein